MPAVPLFPAHPSAIGASSKSNPPVQIITHKPRLDSVDMLRGLIMVIMALDHTKGYFYHPGYEPLDLEKTTVAFFLTRWITHFCAPTFVLLAGTGAFLSGIRGKTKGQLCWFLLTRGLWLALLDLTFMKVAWSFGFDQESVWHFGWDPHGFGIGVLWAIGWSMVALSFLVFLPTSMIVVLGITMIAYHNFYDNIHAPDLLGTRFEPFAWLWPILHSGEALYLWFDSQGGGWPIHWALPTKAMLATWDFQGITFFPGYPLIPWIGVMAAGYGLGALLRLEQSRRRWEILGLGLALSLAFLVLRYDNVYGDRLPWSTQERGAEFTVFSFVNCHKYPPSLMYLLMTLGPAIALLAIFDRPWGALGRFFIVLGRVPLFFYLLHIPLINGLAQGLYYLKKQGYPLEFYNLERRSIDLPLAYLVWIGVVLFLWPLCYWFAGVKRRHPEGILSYF